MRKRKQTSRNSGGHHTLFGLHAVKEALRNPARNCNKLYATENSADALKSELPKLPIRPTITDRKILDRKTQYAVHQGLVLEVDPLPEISVHDLILNALKQESTTLLMLDQVTDPHNIGAILRSACALGADGLILQRKHSPACDGIVAKTASGAVEHLPVAYEVNLSRTLRTLQENKFSCIGLDEEGSKDLSDVKRLDKTAIVLGAEGKGLRLGVKKECTDLVSLHTEGPIKSLNVSNAAAISLYVLMNS